MSFALLGGNALLLKRQNRAAVLRAILAHGPLSRRAICRRTRLTPSTITNIVGELMAEGLVREIGPAQVQRRPQRAGRREVLVDLDRGGLFVVGAHIGVRQVALALGDLKAGIVWRAEFETQAGRGPADLVRRMASWIETLVRETGVPRSRVAGLGAATIGLVDVTTGDVRFSPELGWRDVPLQQLLAEATGLQTVVDNSRRAMALAEMMFGQARGVRDFMLVHIGSTIGAGLVLEQRIYRGSRFGSGQLGHTIVPGHQERCSCGRVGCLDAVASEVGMERLATRRARHMPESILFRELPPEPGLLTREQIYAAASAGDRLALEVIQDSADLVGLAIANVASLLDPELVLLAGTVVDCCPSFVERVRATVEQYAYHEPGAVTRVLPSSFGPSIRAVGGIALALHDLLYAPALTLRPSDVGRVVTGARVPTVHVS